MSIRSGRSDAAFSFRLSFLRFRQCLGRKVEFRFEDNRRISLGTAEQVLHVYKDLSVRVFNVALY